jgi:beta-galactosidase
MEKFFPVSAWYTGGRARATLVDRPGPGSAQEWKKDLEQIRASGFNTVRCWVEWASFEPRRNEQHGEALDLLLELAQAVGLRVVIQVYMDSAPDWLGTEHPDARYVAADGTAIVSQGSPGFCYDHPAVREFAEKFLLAVARRVAHEDVMLGWDLWSEPHIVQWSYFDFLNEPAQFCYCTHTIRRFQEWLRLRYNDMEHLNISWRRTFGDWQEVEPPRFTTLMSYTDSIDWLQFQMDKLAEDLRWRNDLIRQEDNHVTSSHAARPSVAVLPKDGHTSPDDWRMIDSVDVWGTSVYPKHHGEGDSAQPYYRSALLTGTRSACRGRTFWIGELQGGHGYVGTFARRVTGNDVRAYGWQCVAHGAKGLHYYAWYPMTSGIESGGFGLAHLDGKATDRSEAAGEVGRVVDDNMELLMNSRPVAAQAAICWNIYANLMWTVLRETRNYIPSRSYVGAYRALFDDQVPADFVHVDEIETGALSRYRVLYVPFGLALTERSASEMKQFVAGGGVLLAEARTGWNDQAGQCSTSIPGLGLEDLFGCREGGTDGVPLDDDVEITVVRDHPAFPRLKKGDRVCGGVFRETLEPADVNDVVGTFADGEPALVAHKYGDGWGIFAGSLLSFGYFRSQDAATGALIAGLSQIAGVLPPIRLRDVEANTRDLEAHLLYSDDVKRVLIAFNHRSQDAEVVAELADGAVGEVRELVSPTGEPSSIEVEDKHILRRRMPPESVWVMELDS